ncbi:MAG: dUTP diphosphatase [Pseudomonadota bacterium]
MSAREKTPILSLTRLPHGEGLSLPSYETAGAAGADLRAALPEGEVVTLAPKERTLIPTGLKMAIPEGYEVQIRPRSGLAAKHGITVANAPGTIDWDYRGEVKVILINLGQDDFTITRGERVAQMVIAPVTQCQFNEVDTLPNTARGEGGFGSTGK